ncbi:MAG: Gfo/Idh/MocA family oxidoreductase, partial [Nitrospirae bacterium]|nr:Gfo/Idh/MocA family oxidoreductase [Nitrospirota bacterium]
MRAHRIAFIGTGTIARAHAYVMDALSHYYDDLPSRIRDVVASHQAERAQIFATQHGFDRALVLEDFWRCGDIDTVFILGDSIGHFQQLRSALRIVGIRRIYVEKPICMTQHEESQIADIAANLPPEITVQVGFQFLQMGVVRRALRLLKEGLFGSPVHFHIRYLHGAYLEKTYRDVRQSRLQSAPVGGAISDLGSHAFSLAIAFLGTDIEVTAARQAGGFSDVPENSDLCTTVLVHATRSNSIGTLVASRISAGAGDFLEMEFRGTEGAFRFSTE